MEYCLGHMPSPIRRGLGAVAAIAADVRYGRVVATIHAGGAPYMLAADGVKKQAKLERRRTP